MTRRNYFNDLILSNQGKSNRWLPSPSHPNSHIRFLETIHADWQCAAYLSNETTSHC